MFEGFPCLPVGLSIFLPHHRVELVVILQQTFTVSYHFFLAAMSHLKKLYGCFLFDSLVLRCYAETTGDFRKYWISTKQLLT